MEEELFRSFNQIMRFIGFNYEFDKENKEYPFSMGRENVIFQWGQILIPKYGIREMVENKISDIDDIPIKKITMMCQIPFKTDKGIGVINRNISLGFRYDKTYKYGEINKSIYEVCFFVLEHATETNDFFIITNDYFHEFMSYFVINNQWGLGATVICSAPEEKYNCVEGAEQNA